MYSVRAALVHRVHTVYIQYVEPRGPLIHSLAPAPNQVEPNASPADANVSCTTQWDPLTVGTDLYVIGAVFYVVSGVINLTAACVKGRQYRAKDNSARENSAGRLKIAIKATELADTSRA